jgi:hypothetical protein
LLPQEGKNGNNEKSHLQACGCGFQKVSQKDESEEKPEVIETLRRYMQHRPFGRICPSTWPVFI